MVAIVTLAIAATAAAQAPVALTIAGAVELARRDHPAAAEAKARAAAAAEAVNEVRAAYVPRLDALWQLNRASRNNVFGLLLPQNIVPTISGPVLGTDSLESAWGSAAGLLFSVEMFDFGRRSAAMAAARARAAASNASLEAAGLDAGLEAADAYLSALGSEQTVRAARANVERLDVLFRTVKAQVDAELKPGADQSRVDAELASARNQLIASEQGRDLALLRLAAAIGRPDSRPTLDPGRLLELQPGAAVAAKQSPPAVRAAVESARAAEANRQTVERSFRPKVFFNGAIAARASGANLDGTIDNGKGVWPDVPNWAAGITVTFPVLDLAANRARTRSEIANAQAAKARVDMLSQRARFEQLQAELMLGAAQKISVNIPLQVAAARQAQTQARARYEAGLTGVTEFAEAQRLLTQAETEEALASLAMWRARLAEAAAAGDLTGFLAEAAQPTGARVKP
jgi:outer membrane protein TolC